MKVLIANRGEIAERIQRAATGLNWQSQRVHATGEEAPTDNSVQLQGTGVSAYLDIESLVRIAVETACTHVHPGYGFLSESAEFARACADAGLTFVGPRPEILELFGNKSTARQLAESTNVPVIAATHPDASLDDIKTFFQQHPNGIMIKATAGGGGRGMRQVFDSEDVVAAYESCRSEARRAFGIDTVYAERLMTDAKHIEIQILGDANGEVATFGERECSIQRRHQKVIEFAPSPNVSDHDRATLVEAARNLISPLGYSGLATVEFLVASASMNIEDAEELDYAFIEVNPRVQVEHTLTEEIYSVDLVQAQLLVSVGRCLADLGLTGDHAPSTDAYAIQSRINAEQMLAGVSTATTGTITALEWPANARIDTYIHEGSRITGVFDSLIAKVVTRTEGTWQQACVEADAALRELGVTGVETNKELLQQLLNDPHVTSGSVTTDYLDSLLSSEAELPSRAGDTEHLFATFSGTVVGINTEVGGTIGTRAAAITLEAMKMEHPIRPTVTSTVMEIHVAVGDLVSPGDLLMTLAPSNAAHDDSAGGDDIDLDYIRPDLAEVLNRKSLTLDAARPSAVHKRHLRGHLMAREWIELLLDDGFLTEYGSFPVAAQRSRRSLDDLIENTPADGIITGIGKIDGRDVAVLAYDYTVLAGTQGFFNHQKTDRMLQIAKDRKIPVVFFAEGGGGRPGDTDTHHILTAGLTVHTFAMLGSLSGVVPTVGIVTGRCFAGNAALLGSCDLLIATSDSNIGMAGPAMIAGGGLGSFSPEEIGPVSVQAPNGVIDVVVETDSEAIATAQRYLSYFHGGQIEWQAADQRRLRHAIGENRKEVYNQRELIAILADEGSVLELRCEFGIGVVTALVRVEGQPYGLIANDPTHLGGAIDADCADKIARFLQLCDAHGLPVISLCDTPGFMVGPDSEQTATVRHFSRLFVIGAHLRIPMLTIVVRKGYGLGAQAMAGGSFSLPLATIAWPTGEVGGMGLEGAVQLGYAKELEQIDDPEQRAKRYQDLLDAHYESGKALNAAMKREVDEVIDPADSRHWITTVLGHWKRGVIPGGRYIDTW